MSKLCLRLGALALLATAATAQVNPFVVYPQDPERQTLTCTSFVGRPDWNYAAEALLELNQRDFRSVGDANGFMRIFGVYHWLADEKLSTTETYSLVIRLPDAGNGPDMTTAGEVLNIAGLTSPPSTSTARGTWIMYDGFNIQGGQIIPGDYWLGNMLPRIYVGVGLPANPLWPATDGHSLFRADMLNANTGALVGENHNASAVTVTWAGRTTQPSFTTPWSYVMGPFVTSPNLHVGGIDPTTTRLGTTGANFGLGGLYPDISGLPATAPRRDGIMLRVTDNVAPNGLCFYTAGLGFSYPYYEWRLIGTLIGHSHVGDPSNLPITLGLTTLTNGLSQMNVAAPGTISPALVGVDLSFQGMIWDVASNLAEWTNAQLVNF
ncbi:MAG: hypothetical protein RL398_2893 [Planctomycetota bacterium]|jgi:hypothetical protein